MGIDIGINPMCSGPAVGFSAFTFARSITRKIPTYQSGKMFQGYRSSHPARMEATNFPIEVLECGRFGNTETIMVAISRSELADKKDEPRNIYQGIYTFPLEVVRLLLGRNAIPLPPWYPRNHGQENAPATFYTREL